MRIRHFAAAALLVAVTGCDPVATPVTKKGHTGQPPLGTPITFDPAAELDVDGDSVPDGWWWIPFDGTTAPEEKAVCASGATTGLAIHPGTTDDLVIFFDGGGACWSYTTCLTGTAVDRTYGLSKFLVEARDFIPCSITNPSLLPATLAGATVVFVPYCTGDVHGGDQRAEYHNLIDTEVWEHRGHANVKAYLRRLGATYSPRRLVVTGSSAGGFGALLNYELIRWYWPDAKAYLIDDSGPALVNNEIPADFRQAWYDSWNLGAALDPWCLDCRSNMSAAFTELSGMFPADRLALLSHTEDVVMSTFMLDTGAGFSSALDEVELGVLRPTANARAFYDAGSDHMLLTPLTACGANASYVDDHAAGGVALPAWLEQMVSDDAAWATRMR